MSAASYLDTSFVTPYYLPEASSLQVEAFMRRAGTGALALSPWVEVELASLLARDVRMGGMKHEVATAVMGLFRRDAKSIYHVVEPVLADFAEASRLLLPETATGKTGLRGPDALHLAIAKNHGLTLYTLDKTLLAAANMLGVPGSDAGIGGT